MNEGPIYADRAEAGRALAERLAEKKLDAPVALALPRGGLPVALEVALILRAPIDLVLVRKIGLPYQPELAVAAVVDGGHPEIVVNKDVVALTGIGQDYIDAETARELEEIDRRRKTYLQGRARAAIRDRTAIVIDDGIATGATVRAALRALRRRKPKALVLAVPVAPADTLKALRREVDDIVCLHTPEPFVAIGVHYRDFHQVPDDEVVAMLAKAGAVTRTERAPAATN